MPYQLWLRTLLVDATTQNLAHVVACLGPRQLHTLYLQGAPPSVLEIMQRDDAKDAEQDRKTA